MMKKQVIIGLLLILLTACQPANPQADAVKGEKSGIEKIESAQGKEHTESTENTENTKNTGNTKNTANTANAENLPNPAIAKEVPQTAEALIGAEKTVSIQNVEDDYRNYYEIFVASFYDSDGDGNGDLNGVRAKLDYIADMGFTGIWLMPVHPSDTYHKYDVKDYYGIDPAYGSMADMEALLAACQERNIALILDLVVNHTADDHPWFTAAAEYLRGLSPEAEPNPADCPYVNYYTFTKDAARGKSYHPLSGSDWYYEGVFWGEMPDLALDQPEVRAEIEKIMDFWLEKGVSGFRLDAVKEYFSGRTQKNIEFLTWLEQTAQSKKADVYLVGEAWSALPEIAEYYASGLPSFFNFALATSEGKIAQVLNRKAQADRHSAKSFAEAMVKLEQSFAPKNPNYRDALFIANHDNVRAANYFKGDAAKMKAAAGMYLTMTGVSFTYYGEEIGLISQGTKDENKRTAMLWDETGRGRAKNPADADSFEQTAAPVSVQEQDGDSLLRYYQKALHLRQELPAIARGKVKVLAAYSDQDIACVEKTWQEQTLILVYNLSAEAKTIDFSGEKWQDKTLLGFLTVKAEEMPVWQEQKLMLPAYGIAVLGTGSR